MVKAYIMDIKKLSEPEIFEKYYQQMPLTRQKKIDAFRHKKDKMRSLAAGIVLMQGLLDFGVLKGKTEPVIFHYNLHGKPYLETMPELQFNISHAGNYAVAGFGTKELGIDIEWIGREGKRVADRFFTEREQTYLKNIVEKEQWKEEFIKIWTRKESFVKAIGTGLSFHLSDVETLEGFAEETEEPLIHKQYPLWRFYEYRIKDYCITICSQEIEIDKKLVWVEI